MYVIGLDMGTSGVKSTVFDDKANVLKHAYREYDLICSGEGMFELDARILFRKALEVLLESTQGCDKNEIRAICVTSFGESFVCLDEKDEVLANTMIYMDNRGTEECGEYSGLYPAAEIYGKCGQVVDPMFAVYKLRWLHKHNPELMHRVKRICFIADFITYKLGGEFACDYSLAARSGMFNVKEKTWINSATDFARVEKRVLPSPVPGGSVVGTMSGAAAERLGMKAGIKLIVGGHDQILAAIGSGAGDAGDIANGMGTVDCMTGILSEKDLEMDKFLQYNFTVVPFVGSGKYALYAFNMSGGSGIKWFRDTFAKDIAGQKNAYELLNREAPEEPTGLYVLPYFAGGGTPYMDGRTPAAIAGMRLNTSRGKLFRAFMEGESYEMMLNIECLTDAGIDIKRIITVGGGSNSALWMQLRADIFNQKVYLPQNKEAGTLASALMCYASIGLYGSIEEAQKAIVRYEAEFVPDKERAGEYSRYYANYKKMYRMMKELYQKC